MREAEYGSGMMALFNVYSVLLVHTTRGPQLQFARLWSINKDQAEEPSIHAPNSRLGSINNLVGLFGDLKGVVLVALSASFY